MTAESQKNKNKPFSDDEILTCFNKGVEKTMQGCDPYWTEKADKFEERVNGKDFSR